MSCRGEGEGPGKLLHHNNHTNLPLAECHVGGTDGPSQRIC